MLLYLSRLKRRQSGALDQTARWTKRLAVRRNISRFTRFRLADLDAAVGRGFADGSSQFGLPIGSDGVQGVAGPDRVTTPHEQVEARAMVTRRAGTPRNASDLPAVDLAYDAGSRRDHICGQ